jgi:hypothetical protein
MNPGTLYKYSPAFPIINWNTTVENDPLQYECLVLILERNDSDSVMLINGQQYLVSNSDLFQINEEGEIGPSSFDEGFYDEWNNK